MSAVFEQVMAQCTRGCFTGFLRVRAREGNGEIRFLSGIQDGVRFDSVEGDAALERLQSATEPEFEAIPALPPIDVNSTEPVPPEGGLHTFHAAQLMRYCESNSLTCALELEVSGKILTARYRLGELLSVEPDSEDTSKLAEAKQGIYRFRLPRFDLPANAVRQPAAPAVAPKAAAPKPAAPKAPDAAASSARSAAVSQKASPAPASVKIAPTAILTPKAAPAASRAAAPIAARPAAPAAVLHTAPDSASAAAVGRASPQRHVEPVAKAPESPANISARGVRVAASPVDAGPIAPSPPPAAPHAALPHEAAAPLKGLRADAVSPPVQAASVEHPVAAAPHQAPAESPRAGAPQAQRSAERAASPAAAASSGFGSSAGLPPIAPAKAAGIAAKPREAREPLEPPVRKGSSGLYVGLLVVVVAVVGAWLALGRPLP
jgi:hypothetical protein